MTFRYKNAGHLAYIPEPLSSLPELSHAFVEPTKPASPWMSRKPSGSARTSSCSRKARLNRRRRSGLERGRKEGKLEIGRKLIDSRDPRQRTQILPEDHRPQQPRPEQGVPPPPLLPHHREGGTARAPGPATAEHHALAGRRGDGRRGRGWDGTPALGQPATAIENVHDQHSRIFARQKRHARRWL